MPWLRSRTDGAPPLPAALPVGSSGPAGAVLDGAGAFGDVPAYRRAFAPMPDAATGWRARIAGRLLSSPVNGLPSDPLSVQFLRALGIGGNGSDAPVSAESAMGVSAVFRAVSLVSGTLATLPLRTLAPDSKSDVQVRVSSFLDSPSGPPPYPLYTPFEWKELVAVCLLLHGNAYAQHLYNANGAIVGLNLLQPTAVRPERAPEKPGGKVFHVRLDDGEVLEFTGREITHIAGISVDGVVGLSPISLARLTVNAAKAGQRASHASFTSGATVAGLVTPEDDDLSEGEAKTVKATVNSAMTGPENAGRIAVVNRRLKFTPWTMTAVDAQFLQSRTFEIEEIGRWFGVPPHLLGLTEKSTSWGQGIQEQNRGLARYTMAPWTSRIEQRLSRLVPGQRKAEFDYAALLAPAPEDEINLLLAQVNGGLITVNEARRVRNLPPVPNGDTLRLPAGAGAPAPQKEEENANG